MEEIGFVSSMLEHGTVQKNLKWINFIFGKPFKNYIYVTFEKCIF